MADNLLLKYRIQHTLHRSLYVLNCLVNDTIQSDIYFFTFCNGFCSCIWSYIKSDDDGIGCRC